MSASVAEALRPGVPVRHRLTLVRVTQVELRKMFNTRSGFWLIASIAISAVLAAGGVILWAADDQLTYSTFATAIRFPVVVILPLIAILSVTSEWSQRTGLTTFTLVPHRSRIIAAKAISSVSIAVAAMVLTFAVGAVGNLTSAAVTGTALVWDVTWTQCLYYVLGMIAESQQWFRDLQPWVDFQFAQTGLFVFDQALTGEQWANIAVSGLSGLLVPLAVGLAFVMRAEVK
jgi:ABC-2 type transport system permease protein